MKIIYARWGGRAVLAVGPTVGYAEEIAKSLLGDPPGQIEMIVFSGDEPGGAHLPDDYSMDGWSLGGWQGPR